MTTQQLFYHAFFHISKKFKSVLLHSAYSLFWTLERAATNWWLAASKFADGGSTWLQETSRPFQAALLKGNGKHYCCGWVTSKFAADFQGSGGFSHQRLTFPGRGDDITTRPVIASLPEAFRMNPEQSCMILYVCLHARRMCVRPLKWMPFLDCQISSCKDRGKTQNIYPGRKMQAPFFYCDVWFNNKSLVMWCS